MIYYYNREINTEGFECDEKVFVLYKGDAGVSTTSDVFKNKAILQSVKGEGVDARVAVFPGTDVPVITVTGGESVTSVITNVRKIMDSDSPDDVKNRAYLTIKNALVSNGVSSEDATMFLAAARMQISWENAGKLVMPLVVDASEVNENFRASTIEVINEINKEFTQAITSISALDNYTRHQDTCTSDFFIEIPSRQELISDTDRPLLDFIPKRDEVCTPYSDSAAYEPNYAVNGVASYLYPLIEGRKENNGKPLYENEVVYHKALSEWVSYNVEQDLGTDNGTVIDLLSQQYLFELLMCLYMWHWGHNPCVPVEIAPDSSEGDGYESSRYVFCAEAEKYNYNAVIILQQFLKDASTVLGWSVYVDAVIQLGRWGERKPTRIVFDGYDSEFDLGTGLIKKKIGDISDYTVQPVNGKESSLYAVIIDDAIVQDESIHVKKKWSFPVGVVTQKTMRGKSGDDVVIFSYVHCLDVVEMAEAGKLSVDGMEYADGAWAIRPVDKEYTVSQLIKDYENKKDSFMQFPFYRSESFKDLCVELQANGARMPANLLCIMSSRVADPRLKSRLAQFNYSGREGMMDAVSAGVVTSTVAAAEMSIVKQYLPLYECVEDARPYGLEDTLRAFQTFNGSAVKQPASLPVKQSAQPIASFGGQKSQTAPSQHQPQPTVPTPPPVASQPRMVAASAIDADWLKIVPAEAALTPVKDGEETVAYCFVERLRRQDKKNSVYFCYTVVAEESIEAHTLSTEEAVPVERIFALIMHSLYGGVLGHHGLRQIFFENSNAMCALRDRLQSIVKRLKEAK